MALDVIVTTTRISKDPRGRQLVGFLREQAAALGIEDGVVYYDFPTYSDYETISHYNFLLTDYSYFQFSWSAENCVRYAYYPNPYITGRDELAGISTIKRWHELLEAELISFEEYLALLKDSKPEVRIPLIRYENAPSEYVALEHPCSHFHIGHHGENRWALSRALTPNAFTLLLCKLYYSRAWNDRWEDRDGRRFNRFEEELSAEKQKSARLAEAQFTESELKSFHMA